MKNESLNTWGFCKRWLINHSEEAKFCWHAPDLCSSASKITKTYSFFKIFKISRFSYEKVQTHLKTFARCKFWNSLSQNLNEAAIERKALRIIGNQYTSSIILLLPIHAFILSPVPCIPSSPIETRVAKGGKKIV